MLQLREGRLSSTLVVAGYNRTAGQAYDNRTYTYAATQVGELWSNWELTHSDFLISITITTINLTGTDADHWWSAKFDSGRIIKLRVLSQTKVATPCSVKLYYRSREVGSCETLVCNGAIVEEITCGDIWADEVSYGGRGEGHSDRLNICRKQPGVA